MNQAIPVLPAGRLWLVALLLCAFALLGAGGVQAQQASENPYEVTGVHVDVTAENAAAARGTALADGARLALAMLVERYVPEDKRSRFAKMSQPQIEDMISDFSIREEKSSSVRYIATLDYRFKPSRVGRLLRSAGAVLPPTPGQPGSGGTEAPPPPKPIVVVPLIEAGPGQAPEGGADPWRDAWQAAAERSEGRYTLASGDLNAIAGDQERLNGLVRRIGGDSALIAIVKLREGASDAPRTVDVQFTRQSSSRRASGSQSYTQNEGETPQAFFGRVAAAIQGEANSAWRRAAASPAVDRAAMQVAVRIADLTDWLQLQKQIRQVDGVRGFDVLMMSRQEMLIKLSYVGSANDLAHRFEDADLSLSDEDGRRVLARDTTPIEPSGSSPPVAVP